MECHEAAADALVEFRGVRKTYDGENLIVKKLDLTIRRGEFLTLLGPSGSGKTTCLMMLAGFEFPTAGEIRLNGVSMNKVPPHKRNIGMVFQNYALFPHMTVAQNVAYPLTVRGVAPPERAERVKRALDMVQMARFGDRFPSQLSGGQQQRIALARALVFDPSLVLMDEPLGALDKQLREHMQLELKALHQRLGVTFVYVTHDQDEALTMSDRVAVFDQGVIQQLDAVDKLYESSSNEFVAGFIGDNNRLLGKVSEVAHDRCWVRLDDGKTIEGLNIGKAKVGEEVIACVRPERIQISTSSDPFSYSIPARVASLIYFGDHVRVRCAIDEQADCFVKLNLSDPALFGLREDARIGLTIPSAYLRVYKPS